jgi:hypothetical protein
MSSWTINEREIPQAIVLISSERLAKLKMITGDERDAIILHQQMLIVAAALMPVTALLEICLRNTISERLRIVFGQPDWLQNPPSPFVWRGEELNSIRRAKGQAQKAAYAKKTQYEKRLLDAKAFPEGIPINLTHEKRAKGRQKQIQITMGQLIAQLTLTFWKRLLSSDYQAALWDRGLKKIFPDRTIKRADIAEKMEIIHQSRNRIAHHEPLYGKRLENTLFAIEYISSKFGEKLDGSHTLVEKMLEPYLGTLRTEANKLTLMMSQFLVVIETK